jgi:trk system potassium uptake protein
MERQVIRSTAVILLGVALALIICSLVALRYDEPLWPFLLPGVALAGVCWLALTTIPPDSRQLTALESYGIVTGAWFAACVAGALPFLIALPQIGFANAVFESTSGFTTTGSSIFAEVESLPKSILFWRSMSHWLGGMGIVVLAVAFLRHFGIGGLLLMRAEAPGPDVERLTHKITDTAKMMWIIYLGLTVLQTALYLFGGLSLFDAVTHSFGTLATGGFSTRNASIAAFESPFVEWITTIFMVLSGVNFTLYARLLAGKVDRVSRDSEFRAYIGLYVFAVAVVFLSLFLTRLPATRGGELRYAAFQVATLMTSTGFATSDYVAWPGLARGILFLMLFVGGSAGSTSGGIKMIHCVIAAKAIRREVRKARHPRGVFTIFVNGGALAENAIRSALLFILVYLAVVLISTVVVAGTGPGTDLETALTASLAVIGNIGPGFAGVGPTGNFGFLPPATKIWLSAVMIIGRLEIISVLAAIHLLRPRRLAFR